MSVNGRINELVEEIAAATAEIERLRAENKVLQDELDEAYWALEVFS